MKWKAYLIEYRKSSRGRWTLWLHSQADDKTSALLNCHLMTAMVSLGEAQDAVARFNGKAILAGDHVEFRYREVIIRSQDR